MARRSARADLDADKRSLTMRVAALRIRLVLLDREPSRGAGGERHFRDAPGSTLLSMS